MKGEEEEEEEGKWRKVENREKAQNSQGIIYP
jgi:hypothetical protein